MRRGIAALIIIGWISLPALSTNAGSLEMPFDFLHNQIVLRGLLNGRGPYTFILDTGTCATSIDLRVAQDLALPLGTQAVSEGVGSGRPVGRRTTHVALQLGGIVVPHLDAAVFDLSAISRTLGRPLHGPVRLLREELLPAGVDPRSVRDRSSSPSQCGTRSYYLALAAPRKTLAGDRSCG
jgi:Aspartyl protease